MKILRFATIIVIAGLLCSCAPPPKLTFEQQQIQNAKQQCEQEATSMNPDQPTSMNPLWNSYFTMCMNRFGYTDEQINKLWY